MLFGIRPNHHPHALDTLVDLIVLSVLLTKYVQIIIPLSSMVLHNNINPLQTGSHDFFLVTIDH